MNVELLNPFLQDWPDQITATLDDTAHCARWNSSGFYAGSFLAVGRADGFISVWDLETKGVVWVGQGHTKRVESVCWSRNSRFILSSSTDGACIIWDLETGERHETIRFEAPVVEASFHPFNSRIIVATLSTGQAFVVDLRPSSRARHEVFDVVDSSSEEDSDGKGKGKGKARSMPEAGVKKSNFVSTRFSPDGRRLFIGTKSGELLVLDSRTRTALTRLKISNSSVRAIEFDRAGSNLVVNSTDRAVRVLRINVEGPEGEEQVTMEPLHRFQDLINRTPWNGIGFSGDGEYVIAGVGHNVSHDIFVWQNAGGSLMKILEGPKEPLEDVNWHPTRPIIASVSSLGLIHIWVTASADTWSAFAPGFEELEENAIYEEREDEFDVEDASALALRKQQEEDFEIGVISSATTTGGVMDVNREARWWDDEPDLDSKEDWFMPIRLDEEGRVACDWDHLF